MRDMIEGLAICISVGLVFMPLIGFVLFTRYINRKEKAALQETEFIRFRENEQ